MSEAYYDQRQSNGQVQGHGTSAGPPLGAGQYDDPTARSITPHEVKQEQYHLGGSVTSNGASAGNGAGAAVAQQARKKLASWVGFSNLPNQVHRKSVR